MHIRKKIRTRVILLVIAVVLFLYWHGIKNTAAAKGWDCNYHLIYAICNSKNSKATLPSIWDIIKAGAKF
jgi:hypothetical protein